VGKWAVSSRPSHVLPLVHHRPKDGAPTPLIHRSETSREEAKFRYSRYKISPDNRRGLLVFDLAEMFTLVLTAELNGYASLPSFKDTSLTRC
jgi:hypothetical protein